MTSVRPPAPARASRARSVTGSTTPRVWTPPRRRLSPRTSKGYACAQWAEQTLGVALLPWQRWALIHGLEVNPDGSYRFPVVGIEVARQNGKSLLLAVLALWRLAEDGAGLVLGTSTSLEVARESWARAVDLAEEADLAAQVKRGSIDTSLSLRTGGRYKIASASRRGGRGLSVDLGVADELREHPDFAAWGALTGSTTARASAQVWTLSNAGDQRSVVLNALRDQAMAAINSGDVAAQDDLGWFGWTAPADCELDDRSAWAQANPALGHTIAERTLEAKARTLPPAVFRVEHLCVSVESLDAAVDPQAWADCSDITGTMDALRAKVVLGLDVAPDLQHVALVAAAPLADDRVRAEVVAAWTSTEEARQQLPDLLARIKPRALAWFPNGPAAALAPDLRRVRGNVEITAAETPQVCQALAEFVEARRLLHPDDPLLTAQVLGASKIPAGDGWRFTRKGPGAVNSAYALAGAVHLVRSNVAKTGKPRILVPS